MVERIARVTDQVRTGTWERAISMGFVDATGVGQPVVDLLRKRVQSGVVVSAIFTPEHRRAERLDGGFPRMSLGKACLVSRI